MLNKRWLIIEVIGYKLMVYCVYEIFDWFWEYIF